MAVAVALVLSSCGGSSPAPVASEPVPAGATRVTGTERLAWQQAGDVSSIQFVIYVDGGPVPLDATTCNGTAPETECSSPLPPLTDGTHTLAVAARSTISGAESPRSEPITVQKVSARSIVSAASLPDARAASGGARLEATVTAPDGKAFTADVVARSVRTPIQLASTPDGRVLVADGGGLVRVVHPGQPERVEAALDPRALLNPPPISPIALALHPEFARNQFVYISFVVRERDEGTRLRIVRMREAADTLGEPATILEAPLVTASPVARSADGPGMGTLTDGMISAGSRMAFGPDGLLYVLLPPGFEFDGHPAASRPLASMLRLTDEGRLPDGGGVSGIARHPLGFAWHPTSGVLWGIMPGDGGEAQVRPLADAGFATSQVTGHAVIRIIDDADQRPVALEPQDAGAFEVARAFVDGFDRASSGAVRLGVAVLAEKLLNGLSGRVLDVVAGNGTVYLAMDDVGQPDGSSGDNAGFIVRLRLRAQ